MSRISCQSWNICQAPKLRWFVEMGSTLGTFSKVCTAKSTSAALVWFSFHITTLYSTLKEDKSEHMAWTTAAASNKWRDLKKSLATCLCERPSVLLQTTMQHSNVCTAFLSSIYSESLWTEKMLGSDNRSPKTGQDNFAVYTKNLRAQLEWLVSAPTFTPSKSSSVGHSDTWKHIKYIRMFICGRAT
jgi:hypothetical protein